jgi:hypothetical protein
MTTVPDPVAECLRGKRFAIAGASRHLGQSAKTLGFNERTGAGLDPGLGPLAGSAGLW